MGIPYGPLLVEGVFVSSVVGVLPERIRGTVEVLLGALNQVVKALYENNVFYQENHVFHKEIQYNRPD